MEILTAIVVGVVAGILVKALFLKDSQLIWVALFGAVGGLAAYYLHSALTADVIKAVFMLGTAALIAGVFHELWNRFGGKTA